jgi:hypothetical protein
MHAKFGECEKDKVREVILKRKGGIEGQMEIMLTCL